MTPDHYWFMQKGSCTLQCKKPAKYEGWNF